MDFQLKKSSRFALAAGTGESVANSLLCLGSNFGITKLAGTVSLSANLLSQAAAKIAAHQSYFLDSFAEKFDCVAAKCESDYTTFQLILGHLDSAQNDPDVPTKPFMRFLWAVKKQNVDIEDLEESLEKSHNQALMLHDAVSLIVLQIQAQEYVKCTSPDKPNYDTF